MTTTRERPVNFIISASKAFTKWMKIDLPRIPSPDGKRIGRQPINSDETTLSWQVSAVDLAPYGPRVVPERTIIAVEAYSRYCIIIPGVHPMPQDAFEKMLMERWAHEAATLTIEGQALFESQLPVLYEQFDQTPKHFDWFQNSDISVSGHVTDTEQWVKSYIDEYHYSLLNQDNATNLALHINKQRKKAGKHNRFYPVARMLDDVLYRFAKGLSPNSFPGAPNHCFPNPYPTMRNAPAAPRARTPSNDPLVPDISMPDQPMPNQPSPARPVPDNVIDFAKARQAMRGK